MPKSNSSSGTTGNNNSELNSSNVVSTQVPGVDMTQVIASPPHLVRENSSKVENRAIKEDHRK